jgi:hypothetical protein
MCLLLFVIVCCYSVGSREIMHVTMVWTLRWTFFSISRHERRFALQQCSVSQIRKMRRRGTSENWEQATLTWLVIRKSGGIMSYVLAAFSGFLNPLPQKLAILYALDIWKMKIQQMKQCSRSQDACYQAIPPVLLKQGMTAGCRNMCLHIHSEGCIPKANLIKSDSLEFLDGPKASLRVCHHFQMFSLNIFFCFSSFMFSSSYLDIS